MTDHLHQVAVVRRALDESRQARFTETVLAPANGNAGTDMPASERSGQIRAMLREHTVRARIFSGSGLVDPSWYMLLDLLLAHLESRQPHLTRLCRASGVPITNAKRRIEQLIAAGLVRRAEHQADRRRVHLSLTDSGLARLSAYLEQIERKGARRERA